MNRARACNRFARGFVLTSILTSSLSAAVFSWTGGGTTNLLSEAANWGGTVPLQSQGNSGQIGVATVRGDLPGAMELTLIDTTWAKEGTSGNARDVDLALGSTITFTGGSFDTTRHSWWRGGGSYTVNGLAVTVPGDWRLRDACRVNWNSGTAVVGGFTDDGIGGLDFRLAGGSISATSFGIGATGRIDFIGPKTGVLIARGSDYRSTFGAMIAGGKIQVDGAVAPAGRFSITVVGADTRLAYVPPGPPVPVVQVAAFGLTEASSVGTLVGTLAPASPAPGETFSYAITSGNIQNAFAIDALSGRIRVAGGLNYSGVPTYVIGAEAIGSAGTRILFNVTVQVQLAQLATTQWTTAASNASIVQSANWNNGLPSRALKKTGVLNGGSVAKVVGRDDLFSKDLVLNGNARLSGGDRFGGGGGASVTLNDASSWEVGYLDLGRNMTAPTSIQINGTNASFTSSEEILFWGDSYYSTAIFQRGGTVSARKFGGTYGVLHLMGGTFIASSSDVYVNFWPDSTGLFRMSDVQGLTVDPNGNEWDDELYPYGANSYDYAKYRLMGHWKDGGISVAGQWGAPFEEVFNYTAGSGATLRPDQPFTTDASRPIHLVDWVLEFNELSGGVPYIKRLVETGMVTWELGERGSPVGTGTVLYSWTNAEGVELYLSDRALWAESLGSVDSVTFASYLSSYGISGTDPQANPDADALDNLGEFAFGGNPNQADPERAPKLTTAPGPNGIKYTYKFFRRYDAEKVGLRYRLQMSTNLTTWSDFEATEVEGVDSLFESVYARVELPQAFFRVVLEFSPGGFPAVPSEKAITVSRIFDFWSGVSIMPQGDVDLRSPWIHIAKSVPGPYSFRLSQDPTFQSGVIQSQPQKWQFWNPWQDLATGTWHWQWGTGQAGSIQWDPAVYTFNIIAGARSFPMPPTADQMVTIIKNRQLPVLNCNPDQVGHLQDVLTSAERSTFKWEVWKQTYPNLPPVSMTLVPSSYSSRAAFENAIRSNLANKFYCVMRLIRAYAVFGDSIVENGTTYHPKTKALEYLVTIKQNYDTLQWTHDWGSGPQTVTVAAAAANFGGNLGVANYLCDVLDMFENDLDAATLRLFANIAKIDYCKNSFVGADDYLTGNMPIATSMFGRFEHTYWDQHWQQIYILQPCQFLPILMRYHPDLEESFKYSYNVFLYRGTMGGRNDGSWTDGNAYLGASLSLLIDIPAMYSRFTNYSYNFFNYNEWFRNFPRYVYFSSPPGSNHGGTFSDGVGWDPSGGSHNLLAQIIQTFDPATPVAKWNLFRRLGAGGTDVGRIDWVFERTSDAYQTMSVLSAFKQFGRYIPNGTETPPGELARSFPDTGLVTMHTDHRTTANDFYVNFKSSPYGAQNHTHPAQNAFNVGFGGKDLFWHTGYYNTGPYPWHDRLDYKSTWGHNAILPNKVTQLFNSNESYGWLPRFAHGDKITYSLGDATMAYPTRDRAYDFAAGSPKLNEFGYGYPEVARARRHIMMLRPSHLVIYDELEAKHPIPWMYLLQSRTNQNMTKRGDGWITAYNTIAPNTYGIGNFKLFCNAPFDTKVTNYFRFAHPTEFNDKYPDGYQRHHHAYLETTGKHQKMRFLSVIAVSKSGSSTTVPLEITGATGSDGLFTVQLGDYTVKAQLDGNKPTFLGARNADETAALATGAEVQSLTLHGVTNQASLRGNTLLMERGTYRGDIFVQDTDKFPDVFKYGNKYD